MSAISYTNTRSSAAPPPAPAGLPRRAWPFFGGVVLSAALATAAVLAASERAAGEWRAFVVLAVGAVAAHAFVVHTPRNQVFHVGLVFTVAAVLLLPAHLVIALCVVQHLSDWAKERYPWYIQLFNICNYTLAALAGCAALAGIDNLVAADDHRLRLALGASASAAVFVAVNHVLLAPMLALARNHSPRATRLFSFDSISVDVALAFLGAAAALLWRLDIWAVPLVLAPLVGIHRGLAVPQLRAEARIDPKTGLYNARHFDAELAEELGRAARFGRPLSLLMVDLDLLRAINNEHGHLAGDHVLRGVADVFRSELRDYDTAYRFGGEEFAIVLPETDTAAAVEIAERIRRAVAEAVYGEGDCSESPLRATVSIGVGSFPRDASTPEGVFEAADAALYRAKHDGRNRVAA